MKKNSLVLVIILIIAVGVYLLQSRFHFPAVYSDAPSSTSQTIEASPPHAPVNIHDSEKSYPKEPFVDVATGHNVKFVPDSAAMSTNGGAYVYLDQKKIGSVGGAGASLFSFSPDGQYLALRAIYRSGAFQSTFELNVIDIMNEKIIRIQLPQGKLDAFIESYTWTKDDILMVVLYPVTVDTSNKNPVTYRESPKEFWRYDINTKKYTFLQTLPESQ